MSSSLEVRPPSRANAAAAIRALNEQYIEAARSSNVDWFEQHMSPDAIVIFGNGRRVTKDGFLDLMRAEPKNYTYLTFERATVRAFGHTVQVDADARWALSDGAKGVSRYIDTYAWIDGRWQVISAQIISLPLTGT